MTKKPLAVAEPSYSAKQKVEILSRFSLALDTQLSMGPNVHEFEETFKTHTNAPFGVSMNSCTSCLEAALNYFDVTGSDVLIPCATFSATAASISLQGGNPIVCDIDQATLCLTLEIIKSNITKNTKGIIYVHFSGYVSNELQKISDYCKDNNLFLIEDCAHATGGRLDETSVGLIGDVGCFSFYSTKIVTAAEAGIAITKNKKIYKHLRSLQNRGRDLEASHEIYDKIWRNVRLSEFNAILGIVGMQSLDSTISKRKANANLYDLAFANLDGVETFSEHSSNGSVLWKYIILLKNTLLRDELLEYLRQENIFPDLMYTPMIHRQPAFHKENMEKKFQIADDIFLRHLCLPCHEKLDSVDIDRIINTLRSFFT